MYNWEEPVMKQASDIREQELQVLKSASVRRWTTTRSALTTMLLSRGLAPGTLPTMGSSLQAASLLL